MMKKLVSKKNMNGAVLLVAFGLFFYAVTVATPQMLASTAQSMLAQAVGASASVAPNPINTYAKQLTEKETQLNDREKRIAYLEERADARKEDAPHDPYALASFMTSIALFGLVGANFYFDWRRGRMVVVNPLSINLRQRG